MPEIEIMLRPMKPYLHVMAVRGALRLGSAMASGAAAKQLLNMAGVESIREDDFLWRHVENFDPNLLFSLPLHDRNLHHC